MKKTFLNLKTLLVAVGLMAGAGSAWAISVETFGETDYSTAFNTLYSDAISIPADNTATITFKNYSKKEGSYQNWAIALSNDVDHGGAGYTEIVYLRPDNYGWTPSANTNDATWYLSLTNNYGDWGENNVNFYNIMHESDVTLTVVRKGALINIHAAITAKSGDEYYQDFTMFHGTGTETIRAYMTCESAYLTNLNSSVTATAGSTEKVGWATCNADIDFSNAVSDGSVAGIVNSMTVPSNSTITEDNVLRIGADGSVAIDAKQLAGTRDEIIITFDLWVGNLTGKSAGFELRDASSNVIGGLYHNFYNSINSTNTFGFDMSKMGGVSKGYSDIYVNSNKQHVELHLNYSTGTMYAKQWKNGTLQQTTSTVSMGSTNPLNTFWVRSNYGDHDRRCCFDNLKIYTIKGDYSVSEVSYTVKFVDGNGATVKADDTSREAVVGANISNLATSADKTTFYNDGDIANNTTDEFAKATNKYVYKSVSAVNSSDEPITELEADAIVTIVYDKYNRYDYDVKQKLGDAEAISTGKTGTLWSDQTYRYYYPKGIKSGDNYYFTTINGSSPYFAGDVTVENANPVINYTLESNIAYYSEGEDIETKKGTYTHFSADMANASCGAYNEAKMLTLGAGAYTITARCVGRASDRYIDFYKSSKADENRLHRADATNAGKETTSGIFVLTESTDIIVDGGTEDGGQNGNGLDYVVVRQIQPVSATIGATGWTTFASSYALDLSAMTASTGEVAAYYASALDATTVTMTSTDATVAAGTGLMLKGTAGATVTIPVAASGEALSGNKLVGCTSSTNLDASEDLYVLVNNGSTAEFQSLKTNGATIPAGKAYLNAAAGGGAKLRIVVDGDVTGIEAIEATSDVNDGVIYNLAGQRVVNPTKGIFIKNGKKFIVR